MSGEMIDITRPWAIETGHVLDLLARLPNGCVQSVCTSPPYFGLRAYQTEPKIWGGDPNCTHTLEDGPARRPMTGGTRPASAKQVTNVGGQFGNAWVEQGTGHRRDDQHLATWSEVNARGGAHKVSDTNQTIPTGGATCTICGAWRGELGSEPTPDLFVSHLVDVFREVRRVLHPTGLLVVNLGDSYAGSGKGPTGKNGLGDQAQRQGFTGSGGMHRKRLEAGALGNAWVPAPKGVPQKSLTLVPERFALAMLDDGWIVRSRLAGVKIAPMPESCRDRPTSAWEHVYLFSKSRSYYWDQEAVREPAIHEGRIVKASGSSAKNAVAPDEVNDRRTAVGFTNHDTLVCGRNMRNWFYWPPANFAGAHFATFPTSVPEMFVKAGSRPGDLVLDCFSGAGTTVLVANRLGRRGLGLELNPDYAAMARDRIQNDAPLVHAIADAEPAMAQAPLFGGQP